MFCIPWSIVISVYFSNFFLSKKKKIYKKRGTNVTNKATGNSIAVTGSPVIASVTIGTYLSQKFSSALEAKAINCIKKRAI